MSYQPRSLATPMNHSFSEFPAPSFPRSTFDLGFKQTTTANAGVLIPVYVEETLPADTHVVKLRIFGRLLTSDHPVMDNLHIDWHAFHEPNRLVWENWQRFMGERIDPTDSIDFTCPVVCFTSEKWAFQRHGIADYLGYPTNPVKFSNDPSDPSLPNAFVHRGIWDIWNKWYRDQNLQDSFPVPLGDGPDDPTQGISGLQYDRLPPRNKRHTYITAALPWAQKGDAVQLPIGLTAPVIPNPLQPIPRFNFGNGGDLAGALMVLTPGTDVSTVNASGSINNPLSWERTALLADLSDATAATINSLREAIAVQQVLESDARGGTRYVEIIRKDFGAIVPDFRMQRPEYLGGGSFPVDMTAVADTANDLGELGGVATLGLSDSFIYSPVEHGHIIVLASIRADLRFQNFVDRRWTRRTRFDFFRRELAHLGEQSILNREVYMDSSSNPGADERNNEVFGYIPRFDEYRNRMSTVTGMMRSNSVDEEGNPDTLDPWHYALDYDETPQLNGDFIKEDPPIRRTVKDQTGPLFKLDIQVENSCTRILPVDAIPGLRVL